MKCFRTNKKTLISFAAACSLSVAPLSGQEDEEVLLNRLIDDWHAAASRADEDAFFGFMSVDCIYLGTDLTEKWKRDELKEWSAVYFDRDTAWHFLSFEREIYRPDGLTAWFDEKLETWMGPCRASGVLTLSDEGWRLRHYQLSVAIPNEKMDKFIKLIGEKP